MRAMALQNGSLKPAAKYPELEALLADGKSKIWIDIESPAKDDFDFFEKTLQIHPLVLEDMANQNQRPKMEPYDNHIFIVIKSVDPQNPRHQIQLNVVLGANYLLTTHAKPIAALEDVWQRIEKRPEHLARGTDFGLYMVLDAMVDALFPIVSQLDVELEKNEERAFKDPTPDVQAKLFAMKRRLFSLRRAVLPLRDVFVTLSRHDTPLIGKKNSVYYRDVYDHIIRISESMDSSREAMNNAMEGYLTGISNNLNVVMKTLTAITAIIMVPSLIAGIYGMNFGNITDYAFGGTSVAFLFMAASAMVIGGYFKWRGWL